MLQELQGTTSLIKWTTVEGEWEKKNYYVNQRNYFRGRERESEREMILRGDGFARAWRELRNLNDGKRLLGMK